MEKDFTEVMSQRSDRQLAEILSIYKDDYQPEAIEAAQHEFNKRKLETASFVTEAEINEAEELRKPIDPSKENLHWYFKILTFGLPSTVWLICEKIFIDSPPLIFSFIPLAVGIQYIIHHLLLERKYHQIAADFKDWCYYAWYVRIGFVVIGYLVGIIGGA